MFFTKTLDEVAQVLGVTATWLNKAQRSVHHTPQGRGQGSKGFFTEDDIVKFKIIKALRDVGFEFSQIDTFFKSNDGDREKAISEILLKANSFISFINESLEYIKIGLPKNA